MKIFNGSSANHVWRQAAEAVRRDVEILQGSRGGDTRELQDVLFSIEDPTQRWISCRQPPMNPAFAIAEVVWIVNGSNDSAFLNAWNPLLPRFQGEDATYYGAYGWRLRQAFGFDQVAQGYHALRANPETRQMVLQIWDPRLDLPLENGQPRSRDIPCNVCAMLKIRGGRLEWTQVMRSNDLIRGLPHNIVQFTYLQELMAAWLGLELGTYTHLSDSLHVYEEQLRDLDTLGEDFAEVQGERWSLGYEETMQVFKNLYVAMDQMRTLRDGEELLRLSTRADMPGAARNMLLIAGSDAARRRGWTDTAIRLIRQSTDPLLVRLLEAWYRRQKFMVG